jgi:hypothetical protein
LKAFADDTYLHQVAARNVAGQIPRYRDLDAFVNPQSAIRNPQLKVASGFSPETAYPAARA